MNNVELIAVLDTKGSFTEVKISNGQFKSLPSKPYVEQKGSNDKVIRVYSFGGTKLFSCYNKFDTPQKRTDKSGKEYMLNGETEFRMASSDVIAIQEKQAAALEALEVCPAF
jgi:hypothetical protein